MNKFSITYILVLTIIGSITFTSCSKDDDCTEQTWYIDGDNDGYGNASIAQQSCDQPEGYVSNGSDFNDASATAFPGAEEVCGDGIDNDGNGETDECLISGISGNWKSNFGTSFTINESIISDVTYGSMYHILVENSDHLICQNDAQNSFSPELFSRFVFTNITTNEFYYCQSYYDGWSQDYVETAAIIADPNDLDTGCSGFPWSKMSRQ